MTEQINTELTSFVNLLNLVNTTNADTIVIPLTDDTVSVVSDTVLTGESYTNQVELRGAVDTDLLTIRFNKIPLSTDITYDSIYDNSEYLSPNGWDKSTSPQLAVDALVASMSDIGVAPDLLITDITASLVTIDEEELIQYDFNSFVYINQFLVPMPDIFGEIITDVDLNGFDYTPIPSVA